MKLKHLIIGWIILVAALVVVLGWEPIKAGTTRALNSWTNNRGLIGYWNFDECDSCTTAVDRSGNGNLGTMTNGASRTASGKIGNAGNFDGTDDFISTPSITFGTANTVSVWINLSVTGSYRTILGTCDDPNSACSGADYKYFELRIDNNEAITMYFAPSNFGTRRVGATTSSSGLITANRWYHIVGTVDSATNEINIYIDGAQQAVTTDNVSSGTGTFSAVSAIGNFWNVFSGVAGNQYMNGQIDELRLYNRVISEAEVKALYRATAESKVGVQQKTPSNRGLLGFWNFDDCDSCTTAVDRSGNGNIGTMTNGAGRTSAGKIGNAGNFDGSNDYVSINDGSSLNLTGSQTWTAWINTDTLGVPPTNGQRVIVSRWSASNWQSLMDLSVPSAGIVRFAIAIDAVPNTAIRQSATAVSIGRWYHVAGVYNASAQTMDFYLDGVLDNGTLSGSVPTSAADVPAGSASPRIGFKGDGIDAFFDGQIDEVRVYNRALSADEVKTLYNDTRRNFTNTSQNTQHRNGLIGFWSFNGPDISGTTATDRSGNGNNGTLTNGPTVIPGIVGQALNFDGTNDYVDFGEGGGVLDGMSALTLSAWIKNNYSGGGICACDIVGKDDTTNRSYGMAISTSNAIYGYVFNASIFEDAVGTTALNDNRWHHVVTVYDGAAVEVYVDGVNESSGADTITGAVRDTTVTVKAGWNRNGSANYFPGLIDELRIYNRALSASDIAEIYRSGRRD